MGFPVFVAGTEKTTFAEYQEFTESLAVYNTNVEILGHEGQAISAPWLYPVLALAEEAGECAGKCAKFVRKSGQFENVGEAAEELRTAVGLELGDVAYQLSETARMFGYSLDEIIEMNISKLNGRKERGTIVGEGDSR